MVKHQSRVVALFLLALLLGGAVVFSPVDAAPRPVRPRTDAAPAQTPLTTYTSKSYVIQSNLAKDEVLPYGAHMDAVFAEYDRRFSAFRPKNRQPMSLYLFRERPQYVAFVNDLGFAGDNTGGMFFVNNKVQGLATWTSDRPRSLTFQTLQHEGFHQFSFAYFGSTLPTWIEEGMAQYFEDGILVRGSMVVGVVNTMRLQMVKEAMADHRTIGFDDLLNISNENWRQTLAEQPKKASLLYAQAWSVVYFLIHAENGKYRPAFEQLLVGLSKNVPIAQAFRQAFGTDDTVAFRQRWEQYIRDLKPDPLAVTMLRLEMLGQALAFMQKKNMPMPGDVNKLKHTLQRLGYQAQRTYNDVVFRFKADDAENYVYPRGRDTAPFEFQPPANPGEPPRIVAPFLQPTPALVWQRDPAGNLTQDIEFR